MDNSRKKFFLVIGTVFIFIFMGSFSAFAVIDLEVMPTDGSNSLRFGNIDSPALVNAEVRIRITSSDNEQYQLYQRLQEPFINDRGEGLDRDVVSVSAIIGSNASGTLYIQDVERLSMGDQLVYTSNPTGLSDSFTLIYQIDKEAVKASGNFFGKVLYTLRPVSGGPQEEVVLNAYLDSYNDDFQIGVKSSGGADRISLGTASELDMESALEFIFSGHSGQELRIYQELERFPANEDGRLLDQETLSFFVRGAEGGETDFIQPENLKDRRVLVYKGEAREDVVLLNYKLDEKHLKEQAAGNYKGTLNFIVESDMVNQIFPYALEIEVVPVFELSAVYPEGGVSFKELLPDSPAQTKAVTVSVHSNLGKPYEVIQNIQSPMTNEDGEMIEKEYFTMRAVLASGESGRVQTDEFQPVREGNTALFTSDKNGSLSTFGVEYRLRPYRKMPAGRYRTSVVFSLNEI